MIETSIDKNNLERFLEQQQKIYLLERVYSLQLGIKTKNKKNYVSIRYYYHEISKIKYRLLLDYLEITGLLTELEISDQDLADALWLASHMGTVETENSQPETEEFSPLEIVQYGTETTEKQEFTTETYVEDTQEEKDVINLVEEFIPPEINTLPETKGLPFQVPAAPAIQDKLQICRALRPLMRKVPSVTKRILDEEATVTRIAERDIWLPITKPKPERWLSLELIVEETPASFIWQETINELQQLLETHGAFRNVRVWNLSSLDAKLTRRKRDGTINPRQHSYRELIHSNNRGLILFVSDCVSSLWQQGEIHKWLKQWSKYQPTAVIQLFPERLWLSSQLGLGYKVKFQSFAPIVSNSQLVCDSPDEDLVESSTLNLPIITLEADYLKSWAKVIAGYGKSQTPGIVFDLEFVREQVPELVTVETQELAAETVVDRFLATASATAQQLAGYMAAAPVCLPVVNLIQKSLLLNKSTPVNVAEVFLSGMIQRNEQADDDSLVKYDFVPGARKLLNLAMRVDQTERVLDVISAYIAEKLGLSIKSFTALLLNFDQFDEQQKQGLLPFAKVATEVLKNLGGEYADFVEDLGFSSNVKSENNSIENLSFNENVPWALQKSIENNQGQVNCIAFSPDGKLIVSAGNNGTVCLWDIEGNLIRIFEEHQDKVWSLNFSPDGNLVVSGSEDKKLKVFQISSNTILKDWETEMKIYSVAFSSYMPLIAFAGESPIAKMVEFSETEEPLVNLRFTFSGHRNIVNCVIFAPGGQLLASCSCDCTIKLWTYRTGELIRTLIGHNDWVNAIAFSPDGKILVSGSADRTLRLWSVEGECLNVFEGHQGSISSVAFHPNGEVIASGSEDGKVRIWNLQGDCLEILTNENQTNVRTVAFNPEGTILACGGEEQPIYFYSQKTTQLKTFTFDVATIEVKLEFDVATIVPKEQIDNQPQLEEIYFQEDIYHEAFARKGHYKSYQQLSRNELERKDYRIRYREGKSDVAIVAHHGGKIQPGTTEIADAIARKDYAFYSFEGLKRGAKNDLLHIPSHRFDEPYALEIVSKANRVIAIHGLVGDDELINLGGLNRNLKEEIKQSLQKAGFTEIGRASTFPGTDKKNICNRGLTGEGVQIGISWGLRKKLFDSLENQDSNQLTLWNRFIQAIRDVLSPLEAAGWRYQTSQELASFYTEDLEDGVGLEMISIPGGSFNMGAPEDELDSYDSERPVHRVNVSSFYMGRYPITQAQWRVVTGWERVEKELDPDPSRFKEDYEGIDRWTRPVENVSWGDAKEFCSRLSQKTEKKYRLPTEAEWEYACRAKTNTPFHFGETISTDVANYEGNYTYGGGIKGKYREETTPVEYFKVANNFGLSDMHGNVWEWCEDDWHDNSYKGAPTDGVAWLLEASNRKVARGGSLDNDPLDCRSAYRYLFTRGERKSNISFRVVCVDSFDKQY